MRVLTTGIHSGLGRYIHENFSGLGLTRENRGECFKKVKREGVDCIIHCAGNNHKAINSASLYDYISDNVFLAQELVSLPHKKFIFISSIDVYPRSAGKHSEEEIIDMDSVEGIYAVTKLMAESIIRKNSPDCLILRAAAFLGKYSRKNSLIRIMEGEGCSLSLSGDSTFNYILYKDVLRFIEYAIDKGLGGIYNITSSSNISLLAVAGMFNKNVNFGRYRYEAGNIDNRKVVSVFPVLNKTSEEVINQFKEGTVQ